VERLILLVASEGSAEYHGCMNKRHGFQKRPMAGSRQSGALCATTILAIAGCLIGPGRAGRCEVPHDRPNVVFVLSDDLGWRDLGCFGSTFHKTPNMDRLAARGVRFTQAYAASPLCSPTRASILTGQYPTRIGITAPVCHLPQVQLKKQLGPGNANMKAINADSLTRLRPEYCTLAEAFRDAGYATAHFGKWHLGHNLPQNPDDRYEPKDQGFGFDFPHTPAAPGPGGGYLAPWKFIKAPAIRGRPGEHIEDRMSAAAADFYNLRDDLGESRNLAGEKPELVKELDGLIAEFLRETDAVVPVRNPAYREAGPASPPAGRKARNPGRRAAGSSLSPPKENE
jgi:hypothetical protein